MDFLQIFILAVLQGLTEFLPISSSAHLILAPQVLGYADQGFAFDVAVHLGTLIAVTSYFRQQIAAIIIDLSDSLFGSKQSTENSRMGWMIIVATIPVCIFGLLMKSLVETDLRSPLVIATTTLIFGILLYWADLKGKQIREEREMKMRDAIIIGLFQAIAIIPGTSRSGITMTAGLMLGLTRAAASRFSFLLSIPTILMSGGLVTLDLIKSDAAIAWNELWLGALLSFFCAYLCIHLFLHFIERIGMLPFFIYRMLLSGAIFVIIFII